ncbi:hypothetical protein BABINDRAFT_41728 [Babjeviella inositovora NRRL Y-12698]|uniref:5'-AMP-activated protein kinase subunit gamma n=1 Tax=Babjeviella inositovora NRRL Y-12698 TaxID=984486 RepID=A0A1E3QI08_9ASCO|nr:uncharacterized protein BABINDRAFT_41728 [Babjeviella inositovora NRRL Y-12698]ODQ77335.1 hypothetical protein BABINDRAFT_41728 [Babjeviella inositovora NRRL Y-12698]
MSEPTSIEVQQEQQAALESMRQFIKSKTSYDVLPVSYRLIVLDTSLLVKKSLNILLQNNVVSAPLWNSTKSKFAGLLTSTDFINVIQYYFQFPTKMDLVESLTLDGLRDIERAIGVAPMETASIHPFKSLYDACLKMISSKARRIPLVDKDLKTQREIVVSVLTQYRILKFVSLNCKEITRLNIPLKELNIGTYEGLSTVSMSTPVMDVIHLLTSRNVSSVPILSETQDGSQGTLINVYEGIDVLALIKGGIYNDLSLSVGEALLKRPEDFEGVFTCTLNDKLSTILEIIKKNRVHRLFVVDDQGFLKGVVTLSDILQYILLG